MHIDHSKIGELLRDVSEKEILPRWRNLAEQEIDEKSPGEIVTPADRACEAYLQRQLPRILPGSVVIGEESVHENAGLLRALQSDKPVWVLDPLDGTSNFAKGTEAFAVMACLIQNGETLASWVFDPIENSLVHAEKSCGAFSNSVRLNIESSDMPLEKMKGALLTRFLPDDLKPTAEAEAKRFASTKGSGCAGYDYKEFASNGKHFLFYYRTLVWDHAPCTLIAEEAGAYIRRFNGTRYCPTDDLNGLLCATNQTNWRNLQAVLLPRFSGRSA